VSDFCSHTSALSVGVKTELVFLCAVSKQNCYFYVRCQNRTGISMCGVKTGFISMCGVKAELVFLCAVSKQNWYFHAGCQNRTGISFYVRGQNRSGISMCGVETERYFYVHRIHCLTYVDMYCGLCICRLAHAC